MAPVGLAAHENLRIVPRSLHAEPVAEQRTAGEGAGRVHREDANRAAVLAEPAGEAVGQGALAGTGRARDPDTAGLAGKGIQHIQNGGTPVSVVFEQGDDAGQGGPVAGKETVE